MNTLLLISLASTSCPIFRHFPVKRLSIPQHPVMSSHRDSKSIEKNKSGPKPKVLNSAAMFKSANFSFAQPFQSNPLFVLAMNSIPRPVRTVINSGTLPPKLTPRELINMLPLNPDARQGALAALAVPNAAEVMRTEPVLSPDHCRAIRDWARERIRGDTLDSVDGCPEFQVDLPRQDLLALVGPDALARLEGLPAQLDPSLAGRLPRRLGIFVRRYSADSRPHLGLHTDTDDYTVNLALTGDEEAEGGRLLALVAGELRQVVRAQGDATVHAWSVCHGVQAIARGERMSLILFFHFASDNGQARSGAGAS